MANKEDRDSYFDFEQAEQLGIVLEEQWVELYVPK